MNLFASQKFLKSPQQASQPTTNHTIQTMPAHATTQLITKNIQAKANTLRADDDNGHDLDHKLITKECKALLLTLPKEKGWRTPYLYQYQGFWCQPKEIQSIISFQNHFQAKPNDVILASLPKSGTTWLKALTFATINRHRFPIEFGSNRNSSNSNYKISHPLLVSNSHDLVPFFEYKLYANSNQMPDLSKIPDPRILATHIPFASLPRSIKNSNCKIVYISRNPFDTFISSWCFLDKLIKADNNLPPMSMEEGFDKFCNGVIGFGPFWDHLLGYWKESLERQDKVLFLKYEEMKEDVVGQLKKLADFLACPFSMEEESEGVIEEIAKLCSFEKLKDLEVNKSGKSILDLENKHLFRNGKVGDWVNYISPTMLDQLSHVMEEKLGGSGLEFKLGSI